MGGGFPQGPGDVRGQEFAPGIRGGGRGVWFHAEHLLPILLLLVMAGLLIWILVRVSRLATGPMAVAGAPAAAMAEAKPDQALEELRLRYARGDMARDEYLERSADLGAPVTGDPDG